MVGPPTADGSRSRAPDSGAHYEIAADVEASANLLVDRIKGVQAKATTLLPTSTPRRGDLPPSIKRRLRHKRRLHKLWTCTRYPKLKKELNDMSKKYLRQSEISVARPGKRPLTGPSKARGI
ncbi:hypothetical protein EVAR_36974_1 [Eumeta japonica]|uniref:Uncharacterized protein n=1 Tax=Eumeta variegata TaxID=151549 RepID=A0A4C1W9D8_EUMVA|nr:hypothetical protein EVAR_36974_1 [Eumeta japonica]